MSTHKRELGEDYTPSQEDYVAGRLDFQKQDALDAKKVRSFIAKHPGCNSIEIKEGTGVEKPSNSLIWLLRRNLIKNTAMGWDVVPLQDL